MRILDLFSGIGGFSLAASWAGMQTAAFCEIEPFCQKVLQKNFPGIPIYDDVKKLTREQLEKDGVISDKHSIGLVCGGVPCQPFSVAGKQRGINDERYLWPEMYRIIRELRPPWVLIENVTGFVKLALDLVIDDLENEGYEARTFVLPAAAVGAPHRRDRIWIVANTDSAGQQKRYLATVSKGQGFNTWGADHGRTARISQSGVGGDTYGIPAGLDGHRWPAGLGQPQYEWEPPRVATGIKRRKDRLQALGNSIVPQVAYQILKAIMEVEHHEPASGIHSN